MTDILIIGGGGMVGQKFAHSLASAPLSEDDRVTLFDRSFPDAAPLPGERVLGDITDRTAVSALLARRFDIIYLLASVVSGEAERDFRKGYEINLGGFWHIMSRLEAEHEDSGNTYRPRLVFTSSIAVFGPPYPERIDDDFPPAPATSYGTQKAVSELLIADLSRRGIIDGLSLRLPTICVRPGAANLAASSFFSGIIREPLNGQEAPLPVPEDIRHWHASPRSAAGFLRHAAGIDFERAGHRRALNLPGVSCTVGEQIAALRDIAGNEIAALIRPAPDQTIYRIVTGWPRDFDPQLARSLGFRAEATFHDIIRVYLEDDFAAPV
ncbi:NAD-dependent epimerase/dehydratase family protein [Alphaproteobacteria bacterium GH1-50]|uniref:NAD-dependent epimerase/dehydratase family protein n=1 Tax=Kangsaoukella pontilimi TaxID=2691042 RepID=A0A7C9NC19_9RHOB|nr:SDR family oxidoreductase [Kangsaoukella pontilimi]MXQ06359.1 NAD-dependent epimerase/dehydratase family protein [Kangsaoukella pontilimi]